MVRPDRSAATASVRPARIAVGVHGTAVHVLQLARCVAMAPVKSGRTVPGAPGIAPAHRRIREAVVRSAATKLTTTAMAISGMIANAARSTVKVRGVWMAAMWRAVTVATGGETRTALPKPGVVREIPAAAYSTATLPDAHAHRKVEKSLAGRGIFNRCPAFLISALYPLCKKHKMVILHALLKAAASSSKIKNGRGG